MIYETSIEAGILGEYAARIHFDYEPEEKQVLYPIDMACEGCPSNANVYQVEIQINKLWIDVTEKIGSFDIDELSADCLNYYESGEY